MSFVLVADPMCSWCYGFGKEMASLQEHYPEMPLKIVLGGLRAGGTEVLNDAGKQFRLHHWAKVEQLSGLPFNREGLTARQGFVYDTEPVCRAVVAARILAPEANLLEVFRAFQRAFYVDALDTTDLSVLATVGSAALSEAGTPVTSEEFLAILSKQSTIDAAQADFARAVSMGVTGFPTLFLERDGKLHLVAAGYAKAGTLEQTLSGIA
jgi:putative protein-disulfide isomerase